MVTLLAAVLADLVVGVGQARLLTAITTVPLASSNVIEVVFEVTLAISQLLVLGETLGSRGRSGRGRSSGGGSGSGGSGSRGVPVGGPE